MSSRMMLQVSAGIALVVAIAVAFRAYEAVGAVLLLQALPLCG
jgi:hypothetical protein